MEKIKIFQQPIDGGNPMCYPGPFFGEGGDGPGLCGGDTGCRALSAGSGDQPHFGAGDGGQRLRGADSG